MKSKSAILPNKISNSKLVKDFIDNKVWIVFLRTSLTVSFLVNISGLGFAT